MSEILQKTCKFKKEDISVSVNNVARFDESESEKFFMTTYFVDKVIWHEKFLHVMIYSWGHSFRVDSFFM